MTLTYSDEECYWTVASPVLGFIVIVTLAAPLVTWTTAEAVSGRLVFELLQGVPSELKQKDEVAKPVEESVMETDETDQTSDDHAVV